MQTRRGFLRMLGIGGTGLALIPAIKAAQKIAAPAKLEPPVRIGYLTTGSGACYDPANYVGAYEWSYVKDGFEFRLDDQPLRYPAK